MDGDRIDRPERSGSAIPGGKSGLHRQILCQTDARIDFGRVLFRVRGRVCGQGQGLAAAVSVLCLLGSAGLEGETEDEERLRVNCTAWLLFQSNVMHSIPIMLGLIITPYLFDLVGKREFVCTDEAPITLSLLQWRSRGPQGSFDFDKLTSSLNDKPSLDASM